MRDPKRIEPIAKELAKFWKKVPDWRAGQLMSNILGMMNKEFGCDPFFVEDDKILEFLKRLNEETEAKR